MNLLGRSRRRFDRLLQQMRQFCHFGSFLIVPPIDAVFQLGRELSNIFQRTGDLATDGLEQNALCSGISQVEAHLRRDFTHGNFRRIRHFLQHGEHRIAAAGFLTGQCCSRVGHFVGFDAGKQVFGNRL